MTTNILITGKLHPDAVKGFAALEKTRLEYNPDCPREELLEKIKDVHILVTRSETTVDGELMEKAPTLKVVARAAVGVGNIDLEEATKRGVLVMNTPGKNTNSAAELSLGLLLAMMRKIPSAHNRVKEGGWDRHKFTGLELRNKTIGLVGLGHVGHRVAKFCNGFDMQVLGYDPYISTEVFKRNNVKLCPSLEEMVSQVDILSVHVPLNKETNGMIDYDLLKKMPAGSFVVNAARGNIIGEEDILKALNEGHIQGAAIDTFVGEPAPVKALIEHPNVFCSPHIGASTLEAQHAIGMTVVEQVGKFLEGGVVDYPVNLPEVGVMDQPILKAYAVLSEKLGSVCGQILDFNPERVVFHYRGDISGLDNSILRLSWMKGFAGQKLDDYVSFVNVASHIEAMGITLEEATDPNFKSYKSAIKVVVYGASGEEVTVGGVVFDDRYLRISMINDFYFEVEPTGHLLVIENNDMPGVVGAVGTELAQHNVNISSFNLSRNTKGGAAMAMVCVDGELTSEVTKKLKSLDHIVSMHTLSL